MNLRHLVFFKELARTQHMAKAAENLGISQPSLSYAIKNSNTNWVFHFLKQMAVISS